MKYDYIFCGFGLSTMIVLEELETQQLLAGKKILILEKDHSFAEKKWCFWESGAGKWDALLFGQWDKALVKDEVTTQQVLGNFTYKCISSSALRSHVLKRLERHQVVFENATLRAWSSQDQEVVVTTDQGIYKGGFFFNSALQMAPAVLKEKVLLQHFAGWIIQTDHAAFDPTTAVIMDFSVAQKGNTRFMYVLPFGTNTALVEYTLFSPAELEAKEYEQEILKYLKSSGIAEFEVTGKEVGVIPMTAHPFWKANTANVLFIGTAGGWTKASTGYTFAKAQVYAREVARILKSDAKDFTHFYQKDRFNWYDKLFIEVLYERNELGKRLFLSLFGKNKAGKVLQFLSENTRVTDEIKLINTFPKWPFLRVLLKGLF